MSETTGSIVVGMIWMLILSLLLVWLPGLGPFIAGIVGGKLSGGVGPGLLAAILPGILLGLALLLGGTLLTGIPAIGAIIAGSGILLYFMYIPALLLGALLA